MRSIELTYAPTDAWRLSAAYRFGKTNSEEIRRSGYEHVPGSMQQFTAPDFTKYDAYTPSDPNHLRTAAEASEEYAIADFRVGRNVGFGLLGRGASTLSMGLRHADLRFTSKVAIDGVPNRVPRADFSNVFPPFDHYTTSLERAGGFEGFGPMAEWDSSLRLFGDEEGGHLDLDWTVGGGVLFGAQEIEGEEIRLASHYGSDFTRTIILDDTVPYSRSEDVTVPNLSLTLGLSYAIDRVKVSTGYSYDRFFDAIDGGIDEAKQYDRTIHGPYLKLSVGFGGG